MLFRARIESRTYEIERGDENEKKNMLYRKSTISIFPFFFFFQNTHSYIKMPHTEVEFSKTTEKFENPHLAILLMDNKKTTTI